MTDTDLTTSIKELIDRYKQELDEKDIKINLLERKNQLLASALIKSKELAPYPEDNQLVIL